MKIMYPVAMAFLFLFPIADLNGQLVEQACSTSEAENSASASAKILDHKARIEILERQLAESRTELNESKARNALLVQTSVKDRKDLETRLEAAKKNEALLSKLVEELLASSEVELQKLGLRYVLNSQALRRGAGLASVDIIYPRVLSLAQSADSLVAKEAGRALVSISYKKAALYGFQPKPTGNWLPVETYSVNEWRLRKELLRPTSVDYETVPLRQVIEELSENHSVDLMCGQTVDVDQSVTFKMRSEELGVVLDRLVRQLGYVHKVEDGTITILEATDPARFAVLTYNVRGLLGESIEIKDLIKLAERLSGEGESVTLVGEYQIVVSAVESTHRKISRAFGSLTSD